MRLAKLRGSDYYDHSKLTSIDKAGQLQKIHIKEEDARLETFAHMRLGHEVAPTYQGLTQTEERALRLDAIRDDLKDAFCLFDTEGNGVIQRRFVGTVVRSAGLVPTNGELDEQLKFAGDGVSDVDLDAVADIAFTFANKEEPKEALVAAFKEVFDRDDTGYVDPREIIDAAQNTEHKEFTRDEVAKLMEYCGVKDINMLAAKQRVHRIQDR